MTSPIPSVCGKNSPWRWHFLPCPPPFPSQVGKRGRECSLHDAPKSCPTLATCPPKNPTTPSPTSNLPAVCEEYLIFHFSFCVPPPTLCWAFCSIFSCCCCCCGGKRNFSRDFGGKTTIVCAFPSLALSVRCGVPFSGRSSARTKDISCAWCCEGGFSKFFQRRDLGLKYGVGLLTWKRWGGTVFGWSWRLIFFNIFD